MHAFPPDVPSIETDRLRLRTLVAGDAPALFAVFGDPEAMRYWSTPAWTDPDEATRVIDLDRDAVASGRSIRFGLFERDTEALVGCCSLHHVDWSNRRCEIGYILKRSHWGRGLMHEAMGAVLDFAFDALELHRIEADLDPRNVPSARVVERSGFIEEGLLRGRWIVAGEICDSAFYGLLRSDRTGGS